MDNCESCKAPCKCRGTISSVLAAATAVGAYYTVGTWRIVLCVLAVIFLIGAIMSFTGKFCCNCCGDSCAPKATTKPVAKKAAKKKKQ